MYTIRCYILILKEVIAMSKKITVSVPDALHEKMEKWRESFNFSKLFQDSVSEAIQEKENFKQRVKEDKSMKEVIERLKKERKDSETNFFNTGKKDGLDFVQSASYEGIQYALKWKPMCDVDGQLVSHNPIRDEILGDYFKDIFDEYEGIDFVETSHGSYIPNDNFAAWEEGWVKGVQELWEEIKDKL